LKQQENPLSCKTWVQQPSTIIGISLFVGTAAGVVTYLVNGNAIMAHGVAAAVFGAIAMVLPEAPTTQADMNKLAGDMIAAVATKNWAAASSIMADIAAVAHDVQAIKTAQTTQVARDTHVDAVSAENHTELVVGQTKIAETIKGQNS
jgi:hypothetical protein